VLAAGNNFVQLTSSNNLVNVLQMIEHLVLCWSTGPRATHTRVGEEPVKARSVQHGMLQFRVLINGADLGLSNTPQSDFNGSSKATLPLLRMDQLRPIVETTHGSLEPLEGRASKIIDDELGRS
jgi:hypothetical protein